MIGVGLVALSGSSLVVALIAVLVAFVVVEALIGLATRSILTKKGRPGLSGFFLGFLFSLIGLIIAALIKPAETAPDGAKKSVKPLAWVAFVVGIAVFGSLAASVTVFAYIHGFKDDPPASVADQGLPSRSGSDTSNTVATDGTTTTLPAADTTAATAATATTVASADSTATTVASADTTAATATTVADATATTAASSSAAENYTLTMSDDVTKNYVGYRVTEVLFGQNTEGVGRTNKVTGSLTLEGSSITAAEFTTDMTTLKSDETNRDNQFNGRIMETSTYPTATFKITQPIDLGSVPADGTQITANATGDLTLHGVTKSVTIEVKAQRNGTIIDVLGSTNIVFADYSIANPSNGAVTTEDNGTLEFLLTFTKA